MLSAKTVGSGIAGDRRGRAGIELE